MHAYIPQGIMVHAIERSLKVDEVQVERYLSLVSLFNDYT